MGEKSKRVLHIMRCSLIAVVLLTILPQLQSQCVLNPSEENVLSTQLEGSWIIDQELSSWLVPSWLESVDLQEMKFTRNDSIIEIFSEDFCGGFINGNQFRLFMTGEATVVDRLHQAVGNSGLNDIVISKYNCKFTPSY